MVRSMTLTGLPWISIFKQTTTGGQTLTKILTIFNREDPDQLKFEQKWSRIDPGWEGGKFQQQY